MHIAVRYFYGQFHGFNACTDRGKDATLIFVIEEVADFFEICLGFMLYNSLLVT